MRGCSCTEVVLLMCKVPTRPACSGKCGSVVLAAPVLSHTLNAHVAVLKLNPNNTGRKSTGYHRARLGAVLA